MNNEVKEAIVNAVENNLSDYEKAIISDLVAGLEVCYCPANRHELKEALSSLRETLSEAYDAFGVEDSYDLPTDEDVDMMPEGLGNLQGMGEDIRENLYRIIGEFATNK